MVLGNHVDFVHMWTQCGYHIDTTWFLSGYHMVCMWTACGFHVTPCGFQVDTTSFADHFSY